MDLEMKSREIYEQLMVVIIFYLGVIYGPSYESKPWTVSSSASACDLPYGRKALLMHSSA